MRLALFLGLLFGLSWDLHSIGMSSDVGVLAHDLLGSVSWVSDLEHGVLGMDSFGFASFAEVVIRADGALEADALNRVNFAFVALNLGVLDLALRGFLVDHHVGEETLESIAAVFADFLTNSGSDLLLNCFFRRFTIFLVHHLVFRLFYLGGSRFIPLAATTMTALALVSALPAAPAVLLFRVTLELAVLAGALGELSRLDWLFNFLLLRSTAVLKSFKVVLEGTAHDRGTLGSRLLGLHGRHAHGRS